MFRFSTAGYLIVSKLFVMYPVICFSHKDIYTSDNQIHSALELFEKAYSLSPELIPDSRSQNLTPYYMVNGQKIFINQAFWGLIKSWIDIYLEEIKTHCKCDLDSDLLIEEAKIYAPENRLLKTSFEKVKQGGEDLSHLGAHLTAKYGKTVAILKLGAETAETIAAVGLGLKGIHLVCAPIDFMIFPLARKIQKYSRVLFFYGPQMSNSSLFFTARMAWISRSLNRRKKNVFFYIDSALQFNQEQLEKINNEGPKSLFKKKGHRLLWLEKLKAGTDSLFDEIEGLKKNLDNPVLSERDRARIQKRIKRVQNKIERLSKINVKNFFGTRFKRYLLLKSRKAKMAYMNDSDLSPLKFTYQSIGGKNHFWPLAPHFLIKNSLDLDMHNTEHNMNTDFLKNKSQTPYQQSDEVVSGLINEFLEKIDANKNNEGLELRQKSVDYFLSDFHKIFDVNKNTTERLLSAYAVEVLLSHFFSYYLKLVEGKLLRQHTLTFRQRIRLYSEIGGVANLAFEFTDFLTAAAITKKEDKIKFYKYETIEKFFSFLHYFNQINKMANRSMEPEELLKKLKEKSYEIKSISLLKQKNRAVNFIPYVKRTPQCNKLIEKY